jgi:hypothetical protein
MRCTRPFGAISACLALASCTVTPLQIYEGPALPDDQTALISVQRQTSDRTAATVRILSVDTPRGEPIFTRTNSVRVLPRATCIEAVARSSTLDRLAAELCFATYAGGHYEVRALTSGSPLPPQLQAAGGDIQITTIPQSGPYNVSRLFVIDSVTREILAVAEP